MRSTLEGSAGQEALIRNSYACHDANNPNFHGTDLFTLLTITSVFLGLTIIMQETKNGKTIGPISNNVFMIYFVPA